MQQTIITDHFEEALTKIIRERHLQRILLVCDRSFPALPTYTQYSSVKEIVCVFDGFSPNPLYEEICSGVEMFRANHCDSLLAVGGGSSIDSAKCIRAFSKMDPSALYLKQPFPEEPVPLLAIPTTAGTGSESTRFAVCYYKGEKQSVTDDSLLPDYAFLDERNLETLPIYQKKCTLLDALCQAIESYWSIHANRESRQYSQKSICMILENMDSYLSGSKAGAKNMLLAANYAGRAICISQTTAAHAMSYKLTSLYKIPHGRAAFLCLPYVWEYMIAAAKENAELDKQFREIAALLNCETPAEAVRFLKRINRSLFQDDKVTGNPEDIPLLAGSVNAARLKNNPVALDENTLTLLYTKILEDPAFSFGER